MKTFDYSLVKDPQYFKDRRMDAHSDHTYYRDGEVGGCKTIPPVVARIFSGDSTSPLTRDGHGCPKLNAQSFKQG